MTSANRADAATWIVLGRSGADVVAVSLDGDGRERARETFPFAATARWVAERESKDRPRWVWNDAPTWYGDFLAAGVRIARCHDLRLCHAVLRDSALVDPASEARTPSPWDHAAPQESSPSPGLFDLEDTTAAEEALPSRIDDVLAQLTLQRDAVATSTDPARLRLLLAAESAGALIAVELRIAGLPWDVDTHDRLLTDLLGARPPSGGTPAKVEEAARRVRDALGDPMVSLDSQQKLLRALHRAGVLVESTSKWELARQQHPVIEPLLEYKRLARLQSANGWTWLDEWVRDGRFRPVYVPGGVVTGRWASSGGGALQIPRQLRAAVRADPGWRLVVADVAQLEPRVLAALAGDTALAEAARGRDLYAGVVESGATTTRAEAKIAMLGAMYGATTGDSGRLVPRLRKIFPRAMGLVDDAAQVGEDGGVVTTRLGRSSPGPSAEWRELQSKATEVGASAGEQSAARRWARDRGRFTRNFVVQGTAAEWALAWLADLRGRLAALPEVSGELAASASGTVFSRRAHIAFFLHDEVIVHTPLEQADAVADVTRASAAAAGRLLFGSFPLDFPLDLRIVESAEKT